MFRRHAAHVRSVRKINRQTPPATDGDAVPDGPWQKLGADVCQYKNQQYLVIADYYSWFIELVHLPDLISKTLIFKFRNVFARHGLLYVLRTDNARSFNSQEFHQFTQSI